MTWRRQLPAHSPLPLRAVGGGMRALLGGGTTSLDSVRTALKRRFNVGEALLTDSGTSALALALSLAAQRRPGAPVALPAYGCYDLATAADGARVPVVLYDLDPDSLQPELASLERALAHAPTAVVLVDLYGLPVDMPRLADLAGTGGALVIEDAAQAFGARLHGADVGRHAWATILSFGRGKGVTAGHGGALLLRTGLETPVVLPAARGATRDLGTLLAQWALARPSLYAIPSSLPFLGLGETRYLSPHQATALSGVGAAVLARTLGAADQEVDARRRRADRLRPRLAAGGVRVVTPLPAAQPAWLRLPIVATPDQQARLRSARARALGAMPGYPRALADLPGFRERVANLAEAVPGARVLAESLFTLPVHSRVTDADEDALVALLADA